MGSNQSGLTSTNRTPQVRPLSWQSLVAGLRESTIWRRSVRLGSQGHPLLTRLDQHLAKFLGHATRFPSLVLASSGSNSPCYTENGAMIPAESSPSRLFAQLFIDSSPEERARQAGRVRQGLSIMDVVAEDARRLTNQLGTGDRQRLDNYFSSVRDLEQRLTESEAWARRPKPPVDASQPVDVANPNDFIGRQGLMSDMIRLALETDSTRFVAYHLGGSGGVLSLPDVQEGYHALSQWPWTEATTNRCPTYS